MEAYRRHPRLIGSNVFEAAPENSPKIVSAMVLTRGILEIAEIFAFGIRPLCSIEPVNKHLPGLPYWYVITICSVWGLL